MTNEQRELVERLRNSSNSMRHDAADLIEQLAERCERLEALLRGLVSVLDYFTMGQERESRDEWLPKARAALKEGT